MAQTDGERLVAGLLRQALPDVTVNIEHAPDALHSTGFIQAHRADGTMRAHDAASSDRFELITWSTVSRARAAQLAYAACSALRRAWRAQAQIPDVAGALCSYKGASAPIQQRLPGQPPDTYRYYTTVELGVRSPVVT